MLAAHREHPAAGPERRLHQSISVAPMMDWTDRHARYFLRLLLPEATLYTEMVPAQALWHADAPERFLDYDPAEHPLVLQVGDSEPRRLAHAAELAREWGYEHVNLNVGCPSDRVQSGRFGACLMKEPDRVAACVEAMRTAGRLPVSVKTRIGVDDQDTAQALDSFLRRVRDAGCQSFIIHARKAWLRGLSPRENRDVPPLDYERVREVARTFPDCEVILNGGLREASAVCDALAWADGVMIGREACENPYRVARWAAQRAGRPPPDRVRVIEAYTEYMTTQWEQGQRLNALLKLPMGLFNGCPGARRWRRRLAEAPRDAQAGPRILLEALREVRFEASPCV